MQSKADSWKAPNTIIQLFLSRGDISEGSWEGKIPPHTHSTQTRTEAWNKSCYSKGHIPPTHREWLESKWWGSSGWLTSRRMDNVKCKFMGAVFYLWIKRESIQTHRSSQHFSLKTFSLCVSAQRFGSESKTGIQFVEELKDPAPG